MRIALLCKRTYTNKDLVTDKFGRLYEIPKRWAASGHHVHLFTVSYQWSLDEDVAQDHMNIRTMSLPRGFFNFYKRLQHAVKTFQPDVIIASGDSHIGFMGSKIAKRLNIPFVFDLYHYYPNFRSNRLPGMKWMFRKALAAASRVVCDSDALKQKIDMPGKKVTVVEQGVELNTFYPVEETEAKQALGLSTDTVYIGYTGSLGARFDYDLLCSAMEVLYKEEGIRLLIAGNNVYNFDLNKEWLVFLGPLPQDKIPVVIGACRLMLMPYNNSVLSDT